MSSSRNFGLGSRDMERAGITALRNQGELAFSAAGTMGERWGEFCKWAKEYGITKMEQITREDLLQFGQVLAERVEDETMSASTAQNYVSAVNRVMNLARRDKKVWASPTKDCHIPKRSGIATQSRALSEAEHRAAIQRVTPLLASQMDLQRVFGLRFKESCLLDARRVAVQAKREGFILISDGTKGGKDRFVPITSPQQIEALERAAELQPGRSMVPSHLTYIAYARACYRQISNFHSERHSYAQSRYLVLAGAPCPVVAGVRHGAAHLKFLVGHLNATISEARAIDEAARKQVAIELGHERIEITNAYLG